MKIDPNHATGLVRGLYERYHRAEYIHPDPLELVRAAQPHDREVVGLVAAAFALGRVGLILDAVGSILARLEEPRAAVATLSRRELTLLFRGFRYRFFGEEQLVAFLFAIGEAVRRYGSLEACFRVGFHPQEGSLVPALAEFVARLRGMAGHDLGILLSDPAKGSASKRLHLYLRWMVRHDEIDPGGWTLPPRVLLVPTDVHMLRVSTLLGFTRRKQADLRASLEITARLAEICPDDPVKFDFSMTRLGIHPGLSYTDLHNVLS